MWNIEFPSLDRALGVLYYSLGQLLLDHSIVIIDGPILLVFPYGTSDSA